MLSHDLTLNDFICPIPICQPEADLVSILKIFQHSDCDLLAIPRENNTWGIISSKNLLSLLAQFWQHQHNSMIGSPRKSAPGEIIYYLTTQELNHLIQPAIVYQADTKIEEFLGYLKNNLLSNKQNKYLIVNYTGNLQGLLDTEKLLESLVFKFNQSQNISSSLPVLPIISLVGLIDSIALPLKLETAEGEDFYINQCWQELIGTVPEREFQQPQERDLSITNWWIKQQQNVSQKSNDQDHKLKLPNADNCHYLNGDRDAISLLDILSQGSNLNLESEQLSTVISNHCVLSSLLDNFQINSATYSPFSTQIEEGRDWSYVKIPLTLAAEKSQDPITSVYWLVLAIKPSLAESEDNQRQNTSATPEIVADRKLLATISHELKSPLTGIVGLSSLLRAQKLGKLNQRQARYVQLIHSSGKKLMSIVNDLLEFTNLTTGKLPLQRELVNLEPLCRQLYQQVVTKCQSTAEAKSDFIIQLPQLQINIEPGLELAIADKSRLSSILSHLILETIEFSEPPNTLEIRIKCLRGWTAIVISNELEQEVSPLPSLPEDSASLKQRSGLNLIIAKYLAEVLEGDVLSTYSARSCQFTLLLPGDSSQLAHLPSNLSPVVRDDRHHVKNANAPLVLLIENNLGRVNYLSFKLEELGYRVILVRNSIEALKQARKLKPEYILLNPLLPDLNGEDLLSLLKSDSCTQNIPLFILTPSQHDAQYQQLYQQANGFIVLSLDRLDKLVLGDILPSVKNSSDTLKRNRTILCLYPEPEVINPEKSTNSSLGFNLKNWAEQDWSNTNKQQNPDRHRIIEADSLEQAHTLARIWQLDVIVLDSYQLADPLKYLRSLQESTYLSALPLITLDTKTTEAANQIEGLNVYPCLLPAECRSVRDLMQVIQIATDI